jgi:protein TonB
MGRVVFGILCAFVLHALFLLFGGLLLPAAAASHASLQEVEIEPPAAEDKKPDEPEPEKPEQEKADEPPNAEEAIKSLDQAPVDDSVPALDAASLSAITDALLGNAGGGDFGSALSFASGGRIGGTGTAGSGDVDSTVQQAFSLGDLDQQPRAIVQTDPVYPPEMRGKRTEGVVTVVFQVDPTGKVVDLRATQSSHPAFEKPAIDAVRQWKFEPGSKAGKKVAAKMRVVIRFPK